MLVFMLGILLRVLAINQRAFWYDEAFTYHLARLPLNQFFPAALSDNNPPFYYLIIHFVLKLGSNQILLRIPSLLFSLAAMQIIYFQFRNQIGRSTRLIAAMLFAVSPLTIYMATEARLHALGMLEAIFLTSLFFSLLKKRVLKNYVFFTLFGIISAYTQYYLMLLLLPFSWLAFKAGFSKKIWAGILATITVPLLPWLYLSALINHSECACPVALLSLPASLVSPIIGGVGLITLRAFPTLPFALIILFSVTAILTFIIFLKGLRQSFLSSIFLIPLAILTILGSFFTVFSPKAFGVFNPLFFLILAQGTSKKVVAMVILVLIFSVSIIQLTHPFFKSDRLQSVADIVSGDSLPIVHTSPYTYYSINYYLNKQNILLTKNPLSPATVFYIVGGKKPELPRSNAWFVDTKIWVDPKERAEVLKQVSQNFIIEKAFRVDNISVEYLKLK